MDHRPFDSEFDRWLSAAMVSRPTVEPIAGLAERVLVQAAEAPLALDYARRLRRQRGWLWVVNAAAALAIVGTILFSAPGAWQNYQASAEAWNAVRGPSDTNVATQVESSSSATSGDELLWVASASLLAVVIGLAISESLTAGSGVRSAQFTLSYR